MSRTLRATIVIALTATLAVSTFATGAACVASPTAGPWPQLLSCCALDATPVRTRRRGCLCHTRRRPPVGPG